MSLQQIVGTWRRGRYWLTPNPENLGSLKFRRTPDDATDDGVMVPPMGSADLCRLALSAAAAGYELQGLRFLFEDDIKGDPADWERRMVAAAESGVWDFGASVDDPDGWRVPSVQWLIVRRDGVTSAVGRLGRYDAPTDEFFVGVIEPYLQWAYRDEPAPRPRRRLRDVLRFRTG